MEVFAVLQSYIPFLPQGAQLVNDHLAIYRHNSQIEFYTASGPIYSCAENDLYGFRLAQGILVKQTKATPAQLAKALGVNRSTVYRNFKKYEEGGAASLLVDKSNRNAYKLSGKKCRQVQGLLNKGYSLRVAAKQVGITEGCIRYGIRKGSIVREEQQSEAEGSKRRARSSSERSREDNNCAIGIGAKREADRFLASNGNLVEAAPCFSANEGVRHAGVLLALPVLANLGFLQAGRKVYGTLQKGFYGLQAVLLTLAFMALIRIKTPEQLKGRSPGELGIILGLDRCPEVKTLRRKLKEMGLCNRAGDFISFLTKRWTDQDKGTIGFVYIDGHVRPYNGRKHKLPKTHVARRRLCMPATTDFWVNDSNSEPLFYVTAEANNSLLSMLDNEVIPQLRVLAGEGKRVTLIFDREGWSPDCFEKWFKGGFDVITYRKGKYDPWPQESFMEVESEVGGKGVKYLLGERSVRVRKDFWMREVRRLCDDGHQTSVMTTRQDLDFAQIARRMFARWNQENFFRYMREEYALDHLVTNGIEQADVERLVGNPEKKEKRKAIAKLKEQLENLKKEYGDKALLNDETRRPTMRGFNIANRGDKKEIIGLEQQIEKAQKDLKAIPDKIPVKQLMAEHEIVRLETERKMLTDAVKMACYRAETSLLNLLGPYFARNKDEGRAFLKSVFQQPADIIPDEDEGILKVEFHTMSNPRSNRALSELCKIMTEQSYVYPGTEMKLVFKAP
jgi:transposase